MKHLRKALTLILVFAMVMSLGITAFAAGTESYTITITNDSQKTNVSIIGSEYKAYKLFDVTYKGMPDAAAEGAPHSYTVNSDFDKFTYDFGGGPVSGDALVKGVANLSADSVELNKFAEAVYTYAQEKKIAPKASSKAQSETLTLDCTAAGPGYYLVYGGAMDSEQQNLTSALILDTTNPDAAVAPKVEAPKLDKEVTGVDGNTSTSTSAQVGDILTFTLTSKVPDMRGYDTYTMKFSDTMSEGLTLKPDSFKVKVGSEFLAKQDYSVITNSQEIGTKTFQLTIHNLVGKKHGVPITVTYQATLNEKALTNQNESNKAVLEYSNNPMDDGGFGHTPDKKVEVYNFGINVLKFAFNESEGDNQQMGQKLSGAKFVLKNAEDATAKYYKWNPALETESGKVTWEVDQASGTTLITNDAGVLVTMGADGKPTTQTASFNGLKAGTYYLEEIEAPAGYNKLAAPIKVTITENKNADDKITSVTYTFTIGKNVQKQEVTIGAEPANAVIASVNVANKTGTELPSTGGIGTTVFYVVGGLLMVTAAVLLITKKRMTAN